MLLLIQKHKKPVTILGILFILFLFVRYLFALFAPGLWHQDTFLYQQTDGSFFGSDLYAEYRMQILPTDSGHRISFSVNDTARQYEILYDADSIRKPVQIFENDSLVFDGTAQPMGDGFLLLNQQGEPDSPIQIVVNYSIPRMPDINELFPGYTRLFNWAVTEEYDTRGNPAMLFLIIIMLIFLILDIAFPDLYFHLKYALAVDGGTPSDYYRTMQKAGRIILILAMLVCVVMTFTTH